MYVDIASDFDLRSSEELHLRESPRLFAACLVLCDVQNQVKILSRVTVTAKSVCTEGIIRRHSLSFSASLG